MKIIKTKLNIGVCLGKNLIILNENASDTTIRHEIGHSMQARKWGPLYLIVVGIPSITMNILTRLGILDPKTYYTRWPENEADELGGVDRC